MLTLCYYKKRLWFREGIFVVRDKRIDVLKAFGIYFVVLGHMGGALSRWIYTFHMPLFFFATGYLRYGTKARRWKDFTVSKAKNLLIPYVCFWIICQLVRNGQELYRYGCLAYSVGDMFKGLLLGGGYLSAASNCFQLWYLQFMFIAILVFEAIVRYCRPRLMSFIGIAMALVTIPFQRLLPGRPVFHINILPAALVFMLIGYGFKHLLNTKDAAKKFFGNAIFGIVLIGAGAFVSWPYGTNVSEIRRLTYFVGASCSILGFYAFGRLFENIRFVRYIGENTLYILGLHSLIYFPIELTSICLELIGISSGFVVRVIAAGISAVVCCVCREVFVRIRGIFTGGCSPA